MTKTPKKRGRPVGSKNKAPKRYAISRGQLELAKKLGINEDDFIQQMIKQKVIKPIKTDWQALAKNLQAALESQIEDYDILETKMKLVQKESDEIADNQRRYLTIISYLETKLGLNPI